MRCYGKKVKENAKKVKGGEFGHPETKKTGLWLKDLPLLTPTKIVEPIYITGKDGNTNAVLVHVTYYFPHFTRQVPPASQSL